MPGATPQRPFDLSLPPLRADDAELRAAIAEGNLPLLLLVLKMLTGEERWLEEPYRPSRARALEDNDHGGFPEEVQEEIREAAFGVLKELREGRVEVPRPPDEDELIHMVSVSLGEEVPAEYGRSMAEEAGFVPREDIDWHDGRPPAAEQMSVLVIGAGPSGIAVGTMLAALGIEHAIVEKSPAVGGVWWENDYPGAGVDTPTHMYSLSFSPSRSWRRYYAKQPEILGYLQRVAEECGVSDRVDFETEVERLDWDEERQIWTARARAAGGERRTYEARVVISCAGIIGRPKTPKIEGMEKFRGPMFHPAHWDHSVELAGKRVAVIGTGATAMQVVPAIAEEAGRVLVFQRSAQWVAPNPNYLREVTDGARLLMEHVPFYASFYRMRLIWQFQDKLLATLRRDPEWPHPERSVNATNDRHREYFLSHLEAELEGRPDLLEKVVPTYPPYGKRILMDNGWYRTLRRPDVELIAEDVTAFDEEGVISADGEHHPVDVVVLATGFHSTRILWPMEVYGRGGVSLHEQWGDEDASAYLGVAVPNFPNLFLIGGPHTFTGHGGSAIYMAESAIAYTARLLIAMVEGGIETLEVRPEVTEDYNRRIDAEHEQLIWTHPGMTTWYRNRHGRIVAMTPWRGVDYWEMTRTPNLAEFVATRAA
ncbi:MAG: NAD(P)/FAD-dependent oxidoreductase [Actinobacteria bacterium]|nr:NAD(P)/FAD-dependent oxidoreductase [Actinomycetota bacterium]